MPADSAQPTSPRTPASPSSRTFGVRSLITIGVFAAIYFVILAACTMMTMISPAFHLVGIALSTFINAFVIMALLARCPSFGTLTILATVVTGLMVLMGQFWGSLLLGVCCGVAGDAVRSALPVGKKIAAAASYAVFQLWLIGPLLPVILTPEAWFARITVRRGAEYVEAMRALFTTTNLVAFHVLNAIVGIVWALLAAKALKRHFDKSSIL